MEHHHKFSLEKYKWLIENIDDCLFEADLNGTLIFISDQVANIFGFSSEEMKGMRFYEAIHPQDLPNIIRAMEKVSGNQRKISIEFKMKHKEGHYVDIAAKGNVVDLSGKKRFIGVLRDVTANKQMEQKLKESKKKYELFFDKSPEGICIISLEGKILAENQALHALIGYNIEELNQIGFHSLILEPPQREYFMNLFNSRVSFINYELKLISKQKKEFMALVNIELITSSKQEFYYITIRDITIQRLIELKLRESEEVYRSFVENFQGIAFQAHGDYIFDFFHGAVEEITGYSENDFIFGRVKWKDLIYSKDLQEFNNKINLFNDSTQIGEKREYRIRKKDGTIIWIKEFLQKYYNQIRKESCIRGIILDIMDRKLAERVIKEELLRIKEIDRLKDEFIHRASHELKTPLSSITGSIDLILNNIEHEYDSQTIKLLTIIEKAGKRLKTLIDDLLDVSQLELSQLKLKKDQIDIGKLLQNCINDIYYVAQLRNIKMNYNHINHLFLNIDEIRIEQVIMNILMNAIKNTPQEGNIFIDLEKTDGFVDIKIQDTGVGFTSEEKKVIFKKFGKIERYGQGMDIDTEGSGLGLYISKEIIKLHNGSIWVESEGRNKGACFFIHLPTN